MTTVAATDEGIERREFIRTALAGAVIGPLALAACTDDGVTTGGASGPSTSGAPGTTASRSTSTEGSGTVTTEGPAATTEPATSVETTVEPTPTDGSPTALVYRLSTRNQRAPCNACKAHAAHRYFVSDAAAGSGRAHAGCTCDVLAQRTTAGNIETWFTSPGRDVFDDRWT